MKQAKIRITTQNLLIPLSRIERATKASTQVNAIFIDIRDFPFGVFLPYEEDLLKQLQKAVKERE